MASSSKDAKSSTIADVEHSLNLLGQTKITYGGIEGSFVSHSALERTKKLIKSAAKSDLSSDDHKRLSELSAQLNAVNTDKQLIEAVLKEKVNAAREAEEEFKKVKAELTKARTDVTWKGDNPAEYQAMKDEVARLQKELGAAKVNSKKAMKGFDPDEAAKFNAREDALRATVKTQTEELARMNRAKATAEAKVASLNVKLTELEVSKAKAWRQAGELQNAKARSEAGGKKVPHVDIKIDIPLLDLVLGTSARTKLQAIDYKVREDMKDYAAKLIGVATSSRATRSLGDLIKLAYEWMKTKTHAARLVLTSWLVTIEEDLRRGTVRAISVYRDELRTIIGDFKAARKEQAEKGVPKNEFKPLVEAVKETVRRARRRQNWWQRIVSIALKAKSTFRRISSRISSSFSAIIYWVTPRTSPSDHDTDPLVDEVEMEVESDSDDSVVSESEAPLLQRL